MAAQYQYEIGPTYAGMTNVEELATPLPPPRSTFKPYSQAVNLGNGRVRGNGWPVAEWRFGFLKQAQRDQLRAFCPGASACVYIKTRTNDSADSYQVYTATMVWPQSEERDADGRRLDFVVEFINLQEYTP